METEPLNNTETPKPQKAARPPFRLIHSWYDRRILVGMVAVLLLAVIIVPVMLVKLLYREQIVLVVDAEGNTIIGPGVDFSQARALHTSHAELATIGLLSMSPVGFDHVDLLKNLFHASIMKKVNTDLEKALPSIKLKDIHQKPEISKVEVLSTRQEGKYQMYYLRTSGQIIKSGQAQGQPIREVETYELTLQCVRNPKLTTNGRFPLVVTDYILKKGEAEKETQQ